jgi:hypothetical protein
MARSTAVAEGVSPIGGLILDAERKAKKKAGGHASSAPCGCEVTVRWFSANSRSTSFDRCPEHPKPGRS